MPITRYGKSIQVNATTTSSTCALPDGHPSYEVINRGPNNIYIRFGPPAVSVEILVGVPANFQLIPPGAVMAGDLQVGQTHFSLLSEVGISRVVIHMGA